MNKVRFKLDEGAFAPTRAHSTDAGIDIRSKEAATIPGHRRFIFRTGVHVEIPHGYCGLLVSKSGLNVKHGFNSTGLIDEGFTGEIIVALYNLGEKRYRVEKGDKITQLVLLPVSYAMPEIVEDIKGGERGDDGYGSTGR